MSHDKEVWMFKFVVAMKYHEAAWGVVAKLGGIPPIWLIPTVDNENVEQPSVMIKLAKKTKETYNKFDDGAPEKAIRHIMVFHNLALKIECKGKENYECYKQLSDDNKSKITTLGTIDANTDKSILKKRESYEKEIEISQCEMNKNLKEYWSLFECLLHLPCHCQARVRYRWLRHHQWRVEDQQARQGFCIN